MFLLRLCEHVWMYVLRHLSRYIHTSELEHSHNPSSYIHTLYLGRYFHTFESEQIHSHKCTHARILWAIAVDTYTHSWM